MCIRKTNSTACITYIQFLYVLIFERIMSATNNSSPKQWTNVTSVVVLEQFHFVIYFTYIKNEHRNTFNETWTDKATLLTDIPHLQLKCTKWVILLGLQGETLHLSKSGNKRVLITGHNLIKCFICNFELVSAFWLQNTISSNGLHFIQPFC